VCDADLRAIWEADVEAFRDHWGFVEPIESDFEEFRDFRLTDHSLWTVAWHDDEIVGQIRSFIHDDENTQFGYNRGRTEFISTGRKWRGRGIAGPLICERLRLLADRGLTVARLGVHTENPNGAFELYEKYGYHEVNRSTEFEKDLGDTARDQ
jgi:ribosomal protein S18 acetylase RimI-like enzyme